MAEQHEDYCAREFETWAMNEQDARDVTRRPVVSVRVIKEHPETPEECRKWEPLAKLYRVRVK